MCPINELSRWNRSGLIVGGGFTGLLDTYPNAAAAYSVRRLSSTYTGSLIRVRRSSDNAEQDIGYDSNNELDQTALTTFVGANDGFVTTWYDQSGNNINGTQTTASDQPQIVSSGSLITDNGTVAMNCTSDWFALSSTAMSTQSHSIFSVQSHGSGVSAIYGSASPISNINYDVGPPARTAYNAGGNFAFNTTSPSSSQFLWSVMRDNSTTINLYINNVNDPITIGSNALFTVNSLMNRGAASSLPWNGKVQEMVFYDAYKETERADIESNINNYYSIS